LVENPTFFGALQALRLKGARLASVAVGPRHVEPASLRDRILAHGPRMVYLTPTHHNPTGAVMPETARSEIARLAQEFGTPVIEDCTLADMELDGKAPKPIAAFASGGGVVSIGSLSKLFWSSLRIGWIRASVPAIAQLARVKTADDLGSPLLTQTIASQLLTMVREARAIRRDQLRGRRDLLMQLLRKHFPEWTFSSPAGGVFLWVDIGGRDSRRFSQVASRLGVALTPGSMFAADDSFSDFLRIPFLLEEEQLRAGTVRLREAWDEFCSAAVETARPMTIV
jgi:DNA-binding transcriptional MocR family regulator